MPFTWSSRIFQPGTRCTTTDALAPCSSLANSERDGSTKCTRARFTPAK
jgi:hypothetical protein